GCMYLIGGDSGGGSSSSASVYYTAIDTDGNVAGWTSTTGLPQSLELSAAVYAQGFIYVLGGRDGSFNNYQTSFYAKVNVDGTLGAWNTTTNIPVASNSMWAVYN